MTLRHLLVGPEAAKRTKVFSGGACNAITADGAKVRNIRRDGLNAYLEENGIDFFDPQIHEDTHGRGYNYDEDGPTEQKAREVAQVTLYEVGSDTLGAVTCLEILRDVLGGKNVVLWLSGTADTYDNKGRPSFAPLGNLTSSDNPAITAHLAQYTNGGTALRRNLLDFTKGKDNLIVVKSEDEAKAAIERLLNNS